MAEKESRPGKLTPKQEVFVREYLVDLNASAAARRAGYQGKNVGDVASQLLGKTHIQAAIQAGMSKRASKIEMDAEWVLKRLRKESLRLGEGASHSSRVRALELIGKHIGMWAEKTGTEATGADQDDRADDEIENRIRELESRLPRPSGGAGPATGQD